jgi:hypothetical protein
MARPASKRRPQSRPKRQFNTPVDSINVDEPTGGPAVKTATTAKTGVQFEDAFASFGVMMRTERIGRVFDVGGVGGQLRALQEHYRGLKDGHRTSLLELHVTAYLLADILRGDQIEWERFVALPEWKKFEGQKPTTEDHAHSIRYVLRYMIGFGSKGRTESVSNAVAALEPLFMERTPPEKVREIVKGAGGIQKLAKLNRKRQREALAAEEMRERTTEVTLAYDRAGEPLLEMAPGNRVIVEAEILEPREDKIVFKILAFRPDRRDDLSLDD